ncbi:hypothetical protein D9M68_390010 [compost metagenome]
MKKNIFYLLFLSACFTAWVVVYLLAGFYAMSQGCRGISADCYIEEAQLAKSIQSVAVILALITVACMIYLSAAKLWKHLNQ